MVYRYTYSFSVYIYNYTYVCARQHLPQHNFQLVFKKHCVRIGCFGILLKTDIYIYMYIHVCVIHCTYTLRILRKHVCCFTH
jgi:hypothetical protein